MRQEIIFEILGYPRVKYKEYDLFESPKKNYYAIIKNSEYYTLRIMNESKKNPDDRLRVYRIWKDEELIDVICNTIRFYEREGEDAFLPQKIFREMEKQIRETIYHDIGDFEIRNLCALYDAGVRAGSMGFVISDACKEVLQLMLMEPDEYLDPELHQMLLQLPDMYFEFLKKTELHIAQKPERQKRLKEYMKKYSLRDTSEVIIFASYITEDINISDETISKIINLYRENEIFDRDIVKDKGIEKTTASNDHEWKLVSMIIDNKGYRIRHCGPIFFVDYEDRCIATSAVMKLNEKAAQIVRLSINDVMIFTGVKDKLMEYSERIIKGAGFSESIVNCYEQNMAFFRTNGYTKIEDGEYTFPKGIAMKKILK